MVGTSLVRPGVESKCIQFRESRVIYTMATGEPTFYSYKEQHLITELELVLSLSDELYCHFKIFCFCPLKEVVLDLCLVNIFQ